MTLRSRRWTLETRLVHTHGRNSACMWLTEPHYVGSAKKNTAVKNLGCELPNVESRNSAYLVRRALLVLLEYM